MDENVIRDRLRRDLVAAGIVYAVGVLLAAVGFLLPWFQLGPEYNWWYCGRYFLDMGQTMPWILAPIGYTVLGVGAYGLYRGRTYAAWAGMTGILVTLLAVVLLSFAFAQCVHHAPNVRLIRWHPGLASLLLGHSLLLWGSWTSWSQWNHLYVLTGRERTSS